MIFDDIKSLQVFDINDVILAYFMT